MATVKLSMATQVAVSPQEAWAWSTGPAGVGETHTLLQRVLPAAGSKQTYTEMVPGHRFVDQAPRLPMRSWRHERVITPAPGGALVTDHLAFTPRMATPLVRWMVRHFFAHRHVMLARALGAARSRVADGDAAGRAR